ncbi:MAG: helix-hairpin-helix domain-containing protein [Desulfatiglans sp.]|jgi:competence protein ComEA|nr:helix-hairpin-helix domain-containing protein [Desulfatiglans sp.]
MRKIYNFQKVIVMIFLFIFAIAGTVQAGDAAVKIDINKATVQELSQLKGIGEKTAEQIIEYRTSVGKFAKIEDIMNVKGIGEKKFEAIKDHIYVDSKS